MAEFSPWLSLEPLYGVLVWGELPFDTTALPKG
jgi:hypothetical protein